MAYSVMVPAGGDGGLVAGGGPPVCAGGVAEPPPHEASPTLTTVATHVASFNIVSFMGPLLLPSIPVPPAT
jgi:hypothetical protein